MQVTEYLSHRFSESMVKVKSVLDSLSRKFCLVRGSNKLPLDYLICDAFTNEIIRRNLSTFFSSLGSIVWYYLFEQIVWKYLFFYIIHIDIVKIVRSLYMKVLHIFIFYKFSWLWILKWISILVFCCKIRNQMRWLNTKHLKDKPCVIIQ